jgi:hypothetical protein
MSFALEKTLSLLLMILLGIFLRGKLGKEDQKKGLKVVILDLALPAMIFVALLGIKMDSELLLLPLLVLAWNGVMFAVGYYVLPWMGIAPHSPQHRTWLLLFPSLAPGLSCFPFIIEYLGEEALAWAALGDVGNKFFVLVFSYLLAMSWYYRVHSLNSGTSRDKVKSLLLAMLKEPINLVLLAALVLLSLGLNLESLPGFLQETVGMVKDLMTPMILLFIGISVVLKWNPIKKIISVLFLRAGISLLISGLLISLFPFSSSAAVLFAVVLPLSSASFWPFAHMAAVTQLESAHSEPLRKKTFDMELAINVLAVSLPFSTLLILGIFSAGDYFVNPSAVLGLGAVLIAVPLLPKFFSWARNLEISLETKRPSLKRE